MDTIFTKLENKQSLTLDEKKQLLTLYYNICKNEAKIMDIVYDNHGCDTYEDIFRDYDRSLLKDKADGVKEALENIQ